MHYFSKLTYSLSLKNKLEEAVKAYLEENERKVIPIKDLETFKAMIEDGIKNLSESFPRCKPVKAYWWQPGFKNLPEEDWTLEGFSPCRFILYGSKN